MIICDKCCNPHVKYVMGNNIRISRSDKEVPTIELNKHLCEVCQKSLKDLIEQFFKDVPTLRIDYKTPK